MSLELARAPDPPAGVGEPVQLTLSLSLSALEDLPPRAPSEPLRLRLAVAPPTLKGPLDFDALRPAFYAIRVNREDYGVARVLVTPDGRWLARGTDLAEWRLRLPPVPPVLFGGEPHYPLDAYSGITIRVDSAAQALDIESPAQHFADTVVESVPSPAARAATPAPGAFFNYDVSLDARSGATRLGGLFEAATFNQLGVGIASFLAQDIGGGSRFARLDTTWRRDYPGHMKTLLLGDAIGSSGAWGRPVRFGGVRYGTNFATNPAFVTFPIPDLRGEAVLPTTTELYVDGVLRQSGNVPPGPFRITNLPVVTGQGEVRLVVRDLLGREQIVSLPYYASTALLKQGLVDDSYELGFVREDYGIRSTQYGRFVSAAQRRMGMTDRLTLEGRAEVLREQQTLGGGASYSIPTFGVLAAAAAGSRHSERGEGALGLIAFERQVRTGISLAARSQWTTEGFSQIGVQPDQRAPVQLASASAGIATASSGSFGVAYVRERHRDAADNEIASASYTLNVGRSATLVMFALKPIKGGGHAAVGVTLSIGLGERTSAALNVTAQRDANEAVAQIQKNLPAGPGFGYRALAGYGSRGDREEAGFAWQTDTASYTAELGRADDQTALRAGAAGGVALLGGRVFFSRSITDSFGVAHVPGFANVGVLLNNQLVATTDAQGYAMLPRLLPYQSNAVQIDMSGLPLDTTVGAGALEAVPYYRSGVLLQFPVTRAHGAVIRIVLDDGGVLPVGSTVTIAGRPEQFPVAERGEVYVTGLGPKNVLYAAWKGQRCELAVELDAATPQPRLGPFVCRNVQR
ncbi:MAG TPA: fimbria/pilus outer membrane usher protein [Burkholderiales bacterium]|nr:fimbria/pilus outer membrane usher protein [Burkholderiales bacterium]